MEKKFKFRENPSVAKAIYGAVIALLCITAIVIGIVAANNRGDEPLDDTPPISDGNDDGNTDGGNTDTPNDENNNEENENTKTTFYSPVSGSVIKGHSLTTPVFSETLEEWRIHTGIDISTAEGAEVFSAADGEVSAVYNHALLGKTVEITHANGLKTVYSNLANEGLATVGAKVLAGEKIGYVGDTSISELAEEPHLHFAVLLNNVAVNPLDYISEESKQTSLGLTV